MIKQLKVLLSDDRNDFANACVQALESRGHNVTTVIREGNQLLSYAEKLSPDVILMQAFMPGLDALGVIKNLHGARLRKKPVICVISAVGNSDFEQKILAAGADYYFIRPVDPDIIADRITILSCNSDEFCRIPDDGSLKQDAWLEVTVSEIMHQIGVSCTYQGLSVSEGCYNSVGK